MDSNLLNAKSLSVKRAYVYFFILQAHYAYLGKRGLQIVYWLTLLLFWFIPIWPINEFLNLPNKIKKHNLLVYEEMLKT